MAKVCNCTHALGVHPQHSKHQTFRTLLHMIDRLVRGATPLALLVWLAVLPACSPTLTLAQDDAATSPTTKATSVPVAISATTEPAVRYDTDLLPPTFHQGRRQQVLASLPPDAVAVFFSAPLRNRENDVDFEFRQSSDLYYLTGTHEVESALILAPGGIVVDGQSVTEVLFVPPRTAMSDVWLGRRFGAEKAKTELGLQLAVSNEMFEAVIDGLATGDRHHFFHARLPKARPDGSTLDQMVEAYTSRVPVLEATGDRWTRMAFQAVMTIEDEENYTGIKQAMTGRIDPAGIEDAFQRDLFQSFFDSATAEEWTEWRRENIDSQFANGIMLQSVLDRLQMHKTAEEVALLQRAIDVTAEAHHEAMRSIEPGMNEYEVEALVEYIFRRNGAEYAGFPSIVGSGENSVILHYNTNRKPMQAGEVVVIDIGAEYHGYTADITRTVPVDGTFSDAQRTIYEIVLAAQEAGIEAAQPGSPFSAPQAAAYDRITEGLREIGLIQSDSDTRRFFMHGTSHYLGLRVHDVGDGGPLLPGQVITVEPGIYISPDPAVDSKWWNIGVRIEDDVLITDDGPVVMSLGAQKTVEEIEALMAEEGLGNSTRGRVNPNGQTAGSN